MSEKSYKDLFSSLKQYKDEEQYIYKLTGLIGYILYDRDTFVKNSDNEDSRLEFYEFLKDKIAEIYKFYKSKYSKSSIISEDIQFIGCGHTSLAFRVGDIVLKVSKTKNISQIDKFRMFHCLVPIFFNKSFKIDEKEYYNIQLTPLVDTNNIVEEDIYSAYKSLRDLGYIWNDPKPENIGKIIKDVIFENHLYKTGDIVIIDLEDLAYVGEITPDVVLDEISMMNHNRRTYTYETRYIDEKGKSIK